MKVPLALVMLAATVAVAPTPKPSPSAAPQKVATVVCEWTPLYFWPRKDARPRRSGETPRATVGESFDILSGPRESLEGDGFYELNVRTVETDAGLEEHYWIWDQCVSVSLRASP